MPTPTAVADTYSTPQGVPLVVAAPGVLGNDTNAPTSAALVPGTVTGGSVSLASNGSFTFTPTPGFIGTGSFRYTASNADGTSASALVTVNVGDCLLFARVTSASDGQSTVETEGRGKVTWSVRADRINRTAAEVCASKKIPARGAALARYTLAPGEKNFYTQEAVVSEDIVCVLVEAKQEQLNPFLWTVTVHYEGREDPTAELPEVSSQETEYQDYRTADIYGRAVTNSAVDPILGGMPVDSALDSLIITRNLPYGSWDTDLKRGYRNTLNLLPFRLGNQERGLAPIDLAPGLVRLKRITEQRLVKSKAVTVAGAQFYWRVTAELVIDQREYSPKAGAAKELVKHRWVVADAGFNVLKNGSKEPILFFTQRPTEPQLLDGAGGLLVNPNNAWPNVPPVNVPINKAPAFNRTYSTTVSTALTVAAPGLLDGLMGTFTAYAVGGSATNGTVTVNTDGSFTFTPTADFVGYATFRYTTRIGVDAATTGNEGTVVIFVAAAPVLLAFERYEYKDWSPLSALLEDW